MARKHIQSTAISRLVNRSLRNTVILLVALITLYHGDIVDSCSPPNAWKALGVGKRAALADIVMVARAVAVTPTTEARSVYNNNKDSRRHTGLYSARFLVLCHLKDQYNTIQVSNNMNKNQKNSADDAIAPLFPPTYMEVSGFGAVPGHCTASQVLLNHTYIVLARRPKPHENLLNNGSFVVAEVNMQTAAVRLKRRLLRKVSRKLHIKGEQYSSCVANIYGRPASSSKTATKHARNLVIAERRADGKSNPNDATGKPRRPELTTTKIVSVRTLKFLHRDMNSAASAMTARPSWSRLVPLILLVTQLSTINCVLYAYT